MEGDVLQMQEIYKFVKESTDERGMIRGSFRATGIRPIFLGDLKHAGIDLPGSYFDPRGRCEGMSNSEPWIIYALIFGAALFGVQALYWLLISSRTERKIVNRRLALSSEMPDQGAVLEMLRQERGLGVLGGLYGLSWLDVLVMQSGLKLDARRLLVWIGGLSVLFYFPSGAVAET